MRTRRSLQTSGAPRRAGRLGSDQGGGEIEGTARKGDYIWGWVVWAMLFGNDACMLSFVVVLTDGEYSGRHRRGRQGVRSDCVGEDTDYLSCACQPASWCFLGGSSNRTPDLIVEVSRCYPLASRCVKHCKTELYGRPSAPLELENWIPKVAVIETLRYG